MLRSPSIPWLAAVLMVAMAGPGSAAGPASLPTAKEIHATILAAFGPVGAGERSWPTLGGSLADYARQPGGDPARCESTAEAARRILAGGTTDRVTPEAASRWLEQAASAVFEPRPDATLPPELRIAAHLARFHARRALAAVHYNLFLRGLRLAELVAATYQEREVVAAWRELATAAEQHAVPGTWREDLRRLEAGLRELEEQCCPPDPVTLQEKVWRPAPAAPDPRLPFGRN